MFTQSLKLEVRGAQDRVHRYYCEPLSPGGEILDVLSTMRSVVLRQIQEQHEKELKEANPPLQECCKEEPSECCKESGEE